MLFSLFYGIEGELNLVLNTASSVVDLHISCDSWNLLRFSLSQSSCEIKKSTRNLRDFLQLLPPSGGKYAECFLSSPQGVDGIGLDRILDIYSLSFKTEPNRCKSFFFFSCSFSPTHHIPLFPNSNVDLPTFFSDIKDPLVRAFLKSEHPFNALKNYAELTQDNELMSKVEIVNKYKFHIPELVARLKECAESHHSNAGLCWSWSRKRVLSAFLKKKINKSFPPNICCSASDFIVGTVHKAKGLEFNTVVVCDDFIKIPPPGEPLCYYYCPQFSESLPPQSCSKNRNVAFCTIVL